MLAPQRNLTLAKPVTLGKQFALIGLRCLPRTVFGLLLSTTVGGCNGGHVGHGNKDKLDFTCFDGQIKLYIIRLTN